jgi:uncharacterized protein (TIGR02598 family)
MKTTLPNIIYPSIRPPRRSGFSLVEVMLSLAIASLGFITMLGLLPQGLQLSRNAANISAESRIKQKLTGELLTTSWKQLNWTSYGPSRYFNDQGIELTQSEIKSSGGAAQTLAYVASVQMPNNPLDLDLPKEGQNEGYESYLRRVRINIATSNRPDFDFANAPQRLVSSYTAILAKTNND